MIRSKLWQIYDEVATTACMTGHLQIAQQMYTAAIESCGNDRSLSDQKIKSTLGLADTAALRGDSHEAQQLYNKVVNALARYGSKSAQARALLAHALERLAYISGSHGATRGAIKLLQRSLRLSEQIVGSAHLSLAHKLLQLCWLFSQEGDAQAALHCLKRAGAIKAAHKLAR